MLLTINGQNKNIPGTPSLEEVIVSVCKNKKFVIAELNGTILQQHVWPETRLHPNDRLELISFVGGG